MWTALCAIALLTPAVLAVQTDQPLDKQSLRQGDPADKRAWVDVSGLEGELQEDASETETPPGETPPALSSQFFPHLHVPHAHIPVPHIHIPVPDPTDLIAEAYRQAKARATAAYEAAKGEITSTATNSFNAMTNTYSKYADRVPFIEELINIATSQIDKAVGVLNGAGQLFINNINLTALDSLFRDGIGCAEMESHTIPTGINFNIFPKGPSLKTSKLGYCKRPTIGDSFLTLPEDLRQSFKNLANATVSLFQGFPLLSERSTHKKLSAANFEHFGTRGGSCVGDFAVVFTLQKKFQTAFFIPEQAEAGIAVGCKNGAIRTALVYGGGPTPLSRRVGSIKLVNAHFLFKWDYVDILHFEFKRGLEFGSKTKAYSLTTNFPLPGMPFEFDVKIDKICTSRIEACVPVNIPGIGDQCVAFDPFCIYYPSDIPFSSNGWYATGFKASFGAINPPTVETRVGIPFGFSKKYILADLSGSGPAPPITRAPTPMVPTPAPTFSPSYWDSFVNVASNINGGVAFASSSYLCNDTGPGISATSLDGMHCFTNINDGLVGNDNSWLPTPEKKYPPSPAKYGSHFVGIRFSGLKRIVGLRTSRDATGAYQDRSNDSFAIFATLASNPSFDTPVAEWFRIAEFQRESGGISFVSFSNGPVVASGIKVVQKSAATCTDELIVYGEAKEANYINLASRENGGVAFGSSSLLCSSTGPGIALNVVSGIHCFHNINDGNFGNPFSWIPSPTRAQNGHFVGIRFNRQSIVQGIVTSRDATGDYKDRFSDSFTVYKTMAANPSYNTPANEWTQVMQFSRKSPLMQEFRFPAPVTATGIKVTQLSQLSCTDELILFGERSLPVTNVASSLNGGIAFASSSLSGYCNQIGPGFGSALSGIHCYNNINDGKYGNAFSWLPGSSYNGQYFVGVRFSGPKSLVGLTTSRDATGAYRDRGPGAFTVFVTNTSAASFDTPAAEWSQIGSFSRAGTGLFDFSFPNSPISATGIKIVQADPSCATDELEVWARSL